MKNRIVTLLMSIVAIVTCQAAVITATITSKTEAEVFGDETGQIEALFTTTSNYKDRITANNTAKLSVLHLPAGIIDYVAVYMHSNKKSGAGSMQLTLNDVSIASVADKNFSEWPGQTAFTDEYVPIYFSGNWEIDDDATLILQVDASANSLYLNKIEISMSEAEARPYTVTLNWNTSHGDKTTTMTETSVGSGIILPECAQKTLSLNDEEWNFVGWARDRIAAKMQTSPTMIKAGQTFYPSRNTNLYAVYRLDGEEVLIMQDTLYRSGEYAMVMTGGVNKYWMAKGGVIAKSLAVEACEIEMQQDKRYRLLVDYVPTEARYLVEIDGETLTLTNSGTDDPIGYSTTALDANSKEWLWTKGLNHSVAIYFSPVVKDGQTEAKLLMPLLQTMGDDWTYQVKTVRLMEDYEYILLFDVTDVPTAGSSTMWTTHPYGYNSLNDITIEPTKRKIIQNGILLIEKDGVFYDLQGKVICN